MSSTRELEKYQIAVILKMYDEQIIGKAGYMAIQDVRSKIKWQQMVSAYKIKDNFESVARGLVKRKLLSDDGKSMAVLYLDKLGVDFVRGYLENFPNAMKELEALLTKKR